MAEQRFADLPQGAIFAWKGAHYVKTGPLLARKEGSDQSVLVPRSALVTPLTDKGGHPPTPELDLAQLEEELLRLIRGLPLEPADIQATTAKIQHLFQSAHPQPSTSNPPYRNEEISSP